jgi:hypothetical protein
LIDIYDEVGYIKTVLQDGLSEKWERDATLLVRYFKSQGERKRDVRKKIKEKCERSKKFCYDPLVDYKRLNKIVDDAWKKEIPLREIKGIEIPREVVEWFLSLETSVILTDEQIAALKKKRPKTSIKKNVMNWQRIKYLFTLYIWTKVQENYLDRPNMHYLQRYHKRFKQDANLKDSFSMSKEENLLFDLGYINVNYALGIDTIFMIKYDVFKTPVTDENRVILKDEDMYNCGYWLEKQKMGTFICKNCGKEFAHYTKSKQEMGRKYCKECADILKNDIAGIEDYKTIACADCGIEVKVLIKDTKTCRCEECQAERKREQERLASLRYRQQRHATNPILKKPQTP